MNFDPRDFAWRLKIECRKGTTKKQMQLIHAGELVAVVCVDSYIPFTKVTYLKVCVLAEHCHYCMGIGTTNKDIDLSFGNDVRTLLPFV